MAIPRYLAMTGAEFHAAASPPPHMAWMSCLFSPYGSGLTNIPKALPADSLLILSDQVPICGHDPELVKAQLTETLAQLQCAGVLMDFQRSDHPETAALVTALLDLPCPLAVAEPYAKDLDCPIFLPPVPPDTLVEEYLAPWSGRKIWLEAALDEAVLQVTEQGVFRIPPAKESTGTFRDEHLCCHYDAEIQEASVLFHLKRTNDDLNDLLARAEALGIQIAVGLYQELT